MYFSTLNSNTSMLEELPYHTQFLNDRTFSNTIYRIDFLFYVLYMVEEFYYMLNIVWA
jgi:hypothetical protein